ncbi:MAG: DUF6265 family protein [Myxococcota bacterium]
MSARFARGQAAPGLGAGALALLVACGQPRSVASETPRATASSLATDAADGAPKAKDSSATAESGLAALAWLSGTHRTDGPHTVEEVWTEALGGTIFGISRTVVDGRLVAFEFLQIEARGDTIVYIAHPGGRMPGTEFTLSGDTAGGFVFENPEHDFPTRIVYRPVDATHTEVRAENDERTLRFEFTRVP